MSEAWLERAVDLVLALTVLELVWALLRRRVGLCATLLSGLALMGALRLALADAPPHWVALALLLAGAAHAADLALRAARARRARPTR
jgi:hypothetical protein